VLGGVGGTGLGIGGVSAVGAGRGVLGGTGVDAAGVLHASAMNANNIKVKGNANLNFFMGYVNSCFQ
jgi:hypothetical protein